ncbi:nuclease-related domain-containing protein [Amnibacterium kyonggiense]|uniref:Nuclease-like protein n=1 Tax=Amnibacterium kyonggiense TaxID=595671 RepID=A0A4R7FL47_9MICO|nr:nuclease-related domain-containing protein [Amnibacterium kyonggiense]TDS77103.1 nuclease-like protein [Amnibacterium kyonggiense]
MTQTTAPVVPAPTGTMRDRVPAQALLEQVLLQQAASRPRTAVERLVGRDPIAPEARPWFTGAIGERAVAARLTGLPAGWTVLHSLPVGRNGADIDHLVVGPGGVFTVNTKHHVDASVWVAGRTVLVNGSSSPIVQKAEAEARRIDRIVGGVLADPPAVRPVVAVVGAKRMRVTRSPRTAEVLRAEQLRRFLRSQPERLSAAEVRALVARFEDPATWLPTVEAGPELLLAFSGLTREVRAAARVRAGWVVGLLGLTAAGSSAIVLPGLLTLLSGS